MAMKERVPRFKAQREPGRVKAGGGGYDLIVMSTYTAKLMYEQGMLDKMDHSKLATVNKYFDKKYHPIKELSLNISLISVIRTVIALRKLVIAFSPTSKHVF